MKREICLILDDKILREEIKDYLILEGCTVSTCDFGNLNMAIYRAQKPDAIVLGLEDVERFNRFFSQLDPRDVREIHFVPIILYSSVGPNLYLTNAANGFKLIKCAFTSIIDTVMHYANNGTL